MVSFSIISLERFVFGEFLFSLKERASLLKQTVFVIPSASLKMFRLSEKFGKKKS